MLNRIKNPTVPRIRRAVTTPATNKTFADNCLSPPRASSKSGSYAIEAGWFVDIGLGNYEFGTTRIVPRNMPIEQLKGTVPGSDAANSIVLRPRSNNLRMPSFGA